MGNLSNEFCEACKIDAPKVTEPESQILLEELRDWDLINESVHQLQRVFIFSNYGSSLNFANKVANLAEEEDHHPHIALEWGKVTVSWWSHKINGLHKNDFICAAKTDLLYEK